MDYEKKYKEALSLARKMQESSNGTILNKSITITDVFPELKESEESADEKIRKALINVFATHKDYEMFFGVSVEDIRAWLEKQADKEKDKRYEYLEELIVADDIYQMSINEEMIKNAKSKVIDALDKLHLLELLGIEKKNEQKSIDSVEHKFNVDDWLVSIYNSNDLLHIIGVDDKDYEVETPYGNTGVPSIAYVDSHFRRWTINDVKDGDVLAVERDKTPFIFKGFDKFHPECPVAYCGIDDSGIFVNSGDGWWTDEEVYPATKEQRDTLFTKMKEASYEFDFEKKELNKKIEQKSVDKIELKFNVGDWVVNRFGDVWHIDSFDSKNYQVSNGDKYCYFPIKKQNEMHLWTIQDAKDGDVLVTTFEEDNMILMYQSMCTIDTINVHCCLDNKFVCWNLGTFDVEDVKPATKEQRDLLFQTMKEKRYEWDDEKKKLKKIDQKFKVGDWIVTDKNDRVQIKAVNNDYYTIDNGMYFNIPYIDRYCHLWTIQDAQAGDVLVDEDNNIGIYKEIEGLCWHSYIYLGCDNRLRGFSIGGSHIQNNTKLATKEQCDTLMKAMADAGYAFDFDKKKLEITDFSKHLKYSPDAPSIIEHKTAWSDEDEEMLGSIIIDVDYIGEFPDYPTKLDCELKDESNAKIKWLKSIKDRVQPQPKEWSDEDENMLVKIIEEGYLIPSERRWLKSLKNRVQPNLKN